MEMTVHRGTHEVGGTVIELRSKNTRILLDAGYPLFMDGKLIDEKLENLSYPELLEIGVIPDIKGLYGWNGQPQFDGIIISHAHSDHYGLLRYIHPGIPVYLSEATYRLISISLGFHIHDLASRNCIIFNVDEDFTIGDFYISPYQVDHSAFDAFAFELKAEGKRIVYTGDFRGHGRKTRRLDYFLGEIAKGPDLLLIEGTTLGRDNLILTEDELKGKLEEVVRKSEGITLFQSTSLNVERIISIYWVAKACGKTLVMDLYTANILFELMELGNDLPFPSARYSDIKVFFSDLLTIKIIDTVGKKYVKRFSPFRITKRQLEKEQDDIIMMVRPSMLDDFKKMKLKNGIFIYSMWKAYKEKGYQIRFEAHLQAQGFKSYFIHTTGHASGADIQKVIKKLAPKKIVPIHTSFPEKFLEYSSNVEILEDGKEITI